MKKSLKKFNYNLIFFCPSIEEGGVEKNLINICNNLSEEFKISVITANEDKRKFFKKKVFFISPKTKFFNHRSRILKVVICSYLLLMNFFCKKFIILSFQANIPAIILAKILNTKIIIRSNSSPNFYAKNLIKRKIMQFFYSLANKVIVNSDEFKNEFKKFFNIKAVRIYNPLENPKKLKYLANKKIIFPFFDKNSKRNIKILTIGRLVYQKDQITILKALKLLKNKINFKLCIIGKGNLKDNLVDFVKENQMEKHVKLIGYKKNVYPYYRKADIFVLSSLYEGLPNTLIEANYFDLKIISSNCKTGPREILKSNINNKLFKVGDFKELSKYILQTKLKKTKKFKIDKRFDFYNNLSQYKKLILSILQ